MTIVKLYKTKFEKFQELLLLKQTLFSLPWVATTVALAVMTQGARELSVVRVLWILLALLSARFSGMCFNHYIDRKIDAKNPRTANRVLPRGAFSPAQVLTFGLICLGLFFLAMYSINSITWVLSFPIALLISGYSFMKRYTYLCHLVLGMVHFFTPFCAWAAVTDSWGLPPILLGISVLLLITAGDIIYGIQDVEFDSNAKIFSLPMYFGIKKALFTAKFLHAGALISLLTLAYVLHLGFPYIISCLLIAGLFTVCYIELYRSNAHSDKSYIVFSYTNTLTGVLLLVGTIGEWLWRVLS